MLHFRPPYVQDGRIVWNYPGNGVVRPLGDISDVTAPLQQASAIAATGAELITTGIASGAIVEGSSLWALGALAGPVGIAAAAVVAAIALIKALDKSEERKQLAAQRGQYEKANTELISQNFQLESKITEVGSGVANVKGLLNQYGLAGPPGSGLGLCLINCAYNAEKDALANAQGTYNLLQWENEQKRTILNRMITDFEQLKQYLGAGVDLLTAEAKKHKLITIGVGGAATLGLLYLIRYAIKN